MPQEPLPEDQQAPFSEAEHHRVWIERFLGMGSALAGETAANSSSVQKFRTADLAANPPPGYEILGELGRGGMGVVYKARHLRLNRVVALKMILAGGHAGANERIRFLAEAEAVAALRHPAIVALLEYGEHRGQPFFTLEFMPRGSLADELQGVPQPPRRAAALIEQLARGIHYAHGLGIVHRDLKPANVLLAEDGAPKVADFGLARRGDSGTGLTVTGEVLGTPSYMAPEQVVEARHAGPAADVYALGVILYECLTGRPPFRAATSVETLRQVVGREPVSVRRLTPGVPIDLATICHKCLQKEPHKRYASALALAEDCAAFLEGKPIQARAVARVERAWRWCRRNPVLAAAYGLALLVVVLGGLGGGAAWLWYKAELAREQLAEEKRQSDEARARLAEVSYLHWVGLAYREWQDAQVARAEQLLQSCAPERRGWEWYYVHRLCHSELRSFSGNIAAGAAIAFSPDGQRLAMGAADHTIQIRDVATDRLIAICRGHTKSVNIIAFTADGARLFSSSEDRTVRRWDAQTGREVFARSLDGKNTRLAFCPRGDYFATTADPNEVKLWNALSGAEVRQFTGLAGLIQGVTFSPQGEFLAACANAGGQGVIQVWETQTGKPVLSIRDKDGLFKIAFRPDGRYIAGTGDSFNKTVRVWDLHTGQFAFSLIGHTNQVRGLAFSPDNKTIVTGSADGTARLWDAETGLELASYKVHGNVNGSALAFSPDSQRLATACADGTVKLWDATADPRMLVLRGHTGFVTGVKFASGGKRIVSSGCDGIRLWDVASRGLDRFIQAHPRCTECMAVCGDGQFLVSGGSDGSIKLWSANTGKEVWTRAAHSLPVQSTAITSDGALIASASGRFDASGKLSPGEVKLWNGRDGIEIRTLQGSTRGFHSVAFSRDGQTLAGGGRGTLAAWDVASGQLLFATEGHDDSVVDLAFSPDGQHLASASYDKTLKLWDARSGAALYTFRGHTARVTCVAFSPDGQRLASGGDDTYIRIMVARSGEEALSLKGTRGPVHALAFSADGHFLASAGWDKLLRIWDARPVE